MQKVHEKHNKKATRNKISLKSGENHLIFCVICLWHKQATQWDFMFCNKQAYGFQGLWFLTVIEHTSYIYQHPFICFHVKQF